MNLSHDHKEADATEISLQEGPARNYMNALHEVFGGTIGDNSYTVTNAIVRARLNSYSVDPGMEVMVAESWHEKELLIKRSADGDIDHIHFNLAIEGSATQSFEKEEVSMEANSLKGAFVYNGLFDMDVHYPSRQSFRIISIKFRRETLDAFLPEALGMHDDLFSDPQGIGYHAHIPAELEKICKEILHLRDVEFGSRSMIISRGIEALTIMFDVIRKMRKKRQLNGLHPDDFELLQSIKEKLLSKLDEKISLEDLASDFGISVSKLKRDFKSLFECSVYQFYTRARMDEAYRRLKSGEYSVMEVGYDLGYQNLSKFSEMFKKVKGISPSEVI